MLISGRGQALANTTVQDSWRIQKAQVEVLMGYATEWVLKSAATSCGMKVAQRTPAARRPGLLLQPCHRPRGLRFE
ncbi:hypothetical protein [Streptomyces virginiae]|uniref:hypothetical protein n=1 Tax=Streptomyces virginiae TaxID=1961 RepID=UPI0036BB6C4F